MSTLWLWSEETPIIIFSASLLVKVAALSRNPSDFAVLPSIVIGSDPVSGHDVKLIIRLFI